MPCEFCCGENPVNEEPCCWYGKCTAAKGERGATLCICCGAELREVDGWWYHHSQFKQDSPFELTEEAASYSDAYQDFVD